MYETNKVEGSIFENVVWLSVLMVQLVLTGMYQMSHVSAVACHKWSPED